MKEATHIEQSQQVQPAPLQPTVAEQGVQQDRPLQRYAQLAQGSAQVAQLHAYGAVAQRQSAQGGLPGQLKSGIESLSGLAMDDVRVHYNSNKPAQLQAHAYAQGTDIHIAPGQERHLPHEAWHVVQQKQGRVKPTLQLKGIAVNDDGGLEREADVMGGRAMAVPSTPLVNSKHHLGDNSGLESAKASAGVRQAKTESSRRTDSQFYGMHTPIQRYVILGREPSPWYFLTSGATIRRELQVGDIPSVYIEVVKYLEGLHGDAEPQKGLSLKNVAIWKGIRQGAKLNFAKIHELLVQWVGAHRMGVASLTGLDDTAQWKEFDSIEELALALAHEAHPEYLENQAREVRLAAAVNESPWINEQLASINAKVQIFLNEEASTFRNAAEWIEPFLFGSYRWAGRVTAISGAFKSTESMETVTGDWSETRTSITTTITFLHDLMERWSSSGAGSIAAKLHETIGIPDVLENASDLAFQSTMVDEETSDFSRPDQLLVGTTRSTKAITADEHQEVLFQIGIKRMIRAAERSLADINEISRLTALLNNQAIGDEERASIPANIKALQEKIEARKARIAADGFGQLTFNDGATAPEQTLEARSKAGKELPPPNMLVSMLHQKRREREREKLGKVKVDKVDKSSASKGRRNVGTRLENNPDTLLARLFSAPITAGRSMTTARMMQLVEKVGGTPAEKTAVAYALFAYWTQTYNKGLTPVHTFHETMDVARNFGVPYKPFHYPSAASEQEIDFMNPAVFIAMSRLVPDFDLSNVADEPSISVPFGLEPQAWLRFKAAMDLVPRVQRAPGQADAPVNPELVFASVERSPSGKQQEALTKDAVAKPALHQDAAMVRRADGSVLIPFNPQEFRRVPNQGGGDCLFHALSGRNLNGEEIGIMRSMIADRQRELPEAPVMNALRIANVLAQTPSTMNIAGRLMQGRDAIPNEVYARMQEIPGMYAGDDELIEFCGAMEMVVGVVESTGELSIFTAAGRQELRYNSLEQRTQQLANLVRGTLYRLFKTPGHYEMILD